MSFRGQRFGLYNPGGTPRPPSAAALAPLLGIPVLPSAYGTPLTIFPAGLAAWYDLTQPGAAYQDSARTTAASMATNDPVGSLTDFSGNGRHAIGSGATRPALCTDYGRPALYFNGANYLTLPAGVALNPQSVSIFAVYSLRRNYTISGYCLLNDAGQVVTLELAETASVATAGNAALVTANGVVDTGLAAPCNESVVSLVGSASACTFGFNERLASLAALAGGTSAGGVLGGRQLSGPDRFFDGTLRELVVVNGAATAAQQAAARQYLYAKYGLNPLPANRLVLDGDSITFGSGVTYSPDNYPSQLGRLLGPQWEILNLGKPSQQWSDLTAAAPAWVDPRRDAADYAKCLLLAFCGTNDIALGSQTGGQTYTNLGTYDTARTGAGWLASQLFYGTMLDRSGTPGFSTQAAAFNAALRGGSHQRADFAQDFRLGAAGASASTDFFADGIHPTRIGNAVLAAAANRRLGS